MHGVILIGKKTKKIQVIDTDITSAGSMEFSIIPLSHTITHSRSSTHTHTHTHTNLH